MPSVWDNSQEAMVARSWDAGLLFPLTRGDREAGSHFRMILFRVPSYQGVLPYSWS